MRLSYFMIIFIIKISFLMLVIIKADFWLGVETCTCNPSTRKGKVV